MKAVHVILGHSTATMTMDLYGHLFSEAMWQAMERLPAIPLTQRTRASNRLGHQLATPAEPEAAQ